MGLQDLLQEAGILQSLGQKTHGLLVLPLHVVNPQLQTRHLQL